MRAEPKHSVFLSKLLLLFQLCHFCRTENKPKVTATENGTEVVIKAECTNPSCRKEFTWHSQPIMPGTKTAAGNFLLCMATLFSGGSFSRVAQILIDLPTHGPLVYLFKYILHTPTDKAVSHSSPLLEKVPGKSAFTAQETWGDYYSG